MSGLVWYKGVTYTGRDWVDSDCSAFVRYPSLSKLLAANAHIFTDDDLPHLLDLTKQNTTTPKEPRP